MKFITVANLVQVKFDALLQNHCDRVREKSLGDIHEEFMTAIEQTFYVLNYSEGFILNKYDVNFESRGFVSFYITHFINDLAETKTLDYFDTWCPVYLNK